MQGRHEKRRGWRREEAPGACYLRFAPAVAANGPQVLSVLQSKIQPAKKVTMEEARKAHHMRWPRLLHGTSIVTGMMSASILGSWTEDEDEE